MSSYGKKVEEWDVYDVNRHLTGRKHRRGEPLKEGEYHLVVHVLIINEKNELLVQQRQPFKKGWPNMWDITVGGSAIAGETSQQAAERETLEEIGLKVDFSKVRPVFTENFPNGFDDYYFIKKEVDLSALTLQEEEVKAVKWVNKEEIEKMQEDGTMIPYVFAGQIFEFMEYQGMLRKNNTPVDIIDATRQNLASWMSLIEVVKWNFPGLETSEKVEKYQKTVEGMMEKGHAICALDQHMVVGILLYSTSKNMLCCMAVHPDYRRQKIASRMLERMLTRLDRTRDIVVETFTKEDERGIAARAFYQSHGFVEDECSTFEENHPIQKFVLKPNSMQK